ncbi:MAG: DUF5004 domain-containing protein [Lewinellaceae bacterium]|nr:DUF5004 domain-containing protein [Lewinellaceae bacterium]
MKRIKIIFSFIVLVLLSSCNKDDTSSTNTSDIVGTWNLVSLTCNDGKAVTTASGTTITSTFTASLMSSTYKIEFKENPNTAVASGNITVLQTATILGQPISQTITLDLPLSSGSWKLDGNILSTFSSGEPDSQVEIIKLDANTLEYKQILNIVEDEVDFKSTTTATYFGKFTK